MKFHGVKMVGPFINETFDELPTFDSNEDVGRLIYLTDSTLWYGADDRWLQLDYLRGYKGNSSTTLYVQQSTTGFDVLNVIRYNGSQWVKAISNDIDTCATHIITEIIDTSNFICTNAGNISIESHGLTIGQYYFTSNTVPGELTITDTRPISNPMVFVNSADELSVLSFRACKYAD